MTFTKLVKSVIFSVLFAVPIVLCEDSNHGQRKHPLVPLNGKEISTASTIARSSNPNLNFLFVEIYLREPEKATLSPLLSKFSNKYEGQPYYKESLEDGQVRTLQTIPREAFIIALNSRNGRCYEIVINLSTRTQKSIKILPKGVQPMIYPEEMATVGQIAMNDSNVLERLNELGFTNPDLIFTDTWTVGESYKNDPELFGKRLSLTYFFFREFPLDNPFAHPLNFVALTDNIAKKVLHIEELPLYANFSRPSNSKVTLPRTSSNYDPRVISSNFYREGIHPLHTVSEKGPSFTINDHTVNWQKFTIQVGFNSREGLILHQVSYLDHGRNRPLIYRASINEMFIPYGDPRPPYQRKAGFDYGEYGGGYNANSLRPGIDCVSQSSFLDGVVTNEKGQGVVIPNAICISENDGGLLYKRTDPNHFATAVRSQILTLMYITTFGNYDYMIKWNFHQDGTITNEVGLSGQMHTTLLPPGVKTNTGTLVAPQVNAQNHQHIVNARIDFDIDGEVNRASVLDTLPLEESSVTNPFGNGFYLRKTPLMTSQSAITDTSANTNRAWKIFNSNTVNPATGQIGGYKLIPHNDGLLLANPRSEVAAKGKFATHSFWVTTYNERELYAVGDYPNQDVNPGQGLPTWAKRNDSIRDKDIVVWYTIGHTHIPSTDEYPIMKFEYVGFRLKPCNFFQSFAGLDVQPEPIFKDNAGTL